MYELEEKLMETETVYLLPELGALPGVVRQFVQEVLPWGDVFAFYAPMGTGKRPSSRLYVRSSGHGRDQ